MFTQAILIAGQTVLPDDNGSFDDVRSRKSTGSGLVINNVTRPLPVLFTLLAIRFARRSGSARVDRPNII